MKIIFILAFIVVFVGCSNKVKQNNLNGQKLLKEKCTSCHNIDLPPKTYENEKAPPMMAVAFHVHSFIKTDDESQRIPKAVAFVKDYVINPSASKSFCDKESLKLYGVMPSQKGKVTRDELDAIAHYMFEHFTQKNLDEAQNMQNKLNAMPKGKRLAFKHKCLTCHRVNKHIVGPSFKVIAKKDANNLTVLMQSIKNGSSKKYNSSKGAIMPAFKNLSDKDIKTIAEWIMKLNS